MEPRRADAATNEPDRERSIKTLGDALGGLMRPALVPSGRVSDLEPAISDRVRDSVCQFTAEWRAAGEPPERVVVGVKTALRLALREDAGQENLRVMTRRAVQWCIGAYYRDD
jgi:hypothetical protein